MFAFLLEGFGTVVFRKWILMLKKYIFIWFFMSFYQIHARTHKCWRVSCNCGIVVKEGDDVISINYCGNKHKPFVGFLSTKEPAFGVGIQKSGHTYIVCYLIFCFNSTCIIQWRRFELAIILRFYPLLYLIFSYLFVS